MDRALPDEEGKKLLIVTSGRVLAALTIARAVRRTALFRFIWNGRLSAFVWCAMVAQVEQAILRRVFRIGCDYPSDPVP